MIKILFVRISKKKNLKKLVINYKKNLKIILKIIKFKKFPNRYMQTSLCYDSMILNYNLKSRKFVLSFILSHPFK